MGTFYKATRVDGTDFRTGTVDYAALCGTGRCLPEKPTQFMGFRCCTDGVYHASTSKADTLIGGDWPCRLFEVEGDEVAQEDNKRGFRTLKVIRELPAWEALGPNGQEVAALVERAKLLTIDEERKLGAARYADTNVGTWLDVMEAAGDAAANAARYAAWGAARNAAFHAARGASWDAPRYAAAYAAGALAVRDLIPEAHFNVLYGPWRSVIERV